MSMGDISLFTVKALISYLTVLLELNIRHMQKHS